MTAEELADEEWGPVKDKGKKAKKGKGKKGKVQDDEDGEAKAGEWCQSLCISYTSASDPKK